MIETRVGTMSWLHSEDARLVRFVCTGGLATILQLSMMLILSRLGWMPLLANATSLLLAAQVNFAMSYSFTWRARRQSRSLKQAWLLYHASIAGMSTLNMLVFTTAHFWLPVLAASALGTALAAFGNFTAGDRLIFRRQPVLNLVREVA